MIRILTTIRKISRNNNPHHNNIPNIPSNPHRRNSLPPSNNLSKERMVLKGFQDLLDRKVLSDSRVHLEDMVQL